jgi:hypothetical protein
VRNGVQSPKPQPPPQQQQQQQQQRFQPIHWEIDIKSRTGILNQSVASVMKKLPYFILGTFGDWILHENCLRDGYMLIQRASVWVNVIGLKISLR